MEERAGMQDGARVHLDDRAQVRPEGRDIIHPAEAVIALRVGDHGGEAGIAQLTDGGKDGVALRVRIELQQHIGRAVEGGHGAVPQKFRQVAGREDLRSREEADLKALPVRPGLGLIEVGLVHIQGKRLLRGHGVAGAAHGVHTVFLSEAEHGLGVGDVPGAVIHAVDQVAVKICEERRGHHFFLLSSLR